ncbi:MAG: chemotaxis protein CheW [Pseudomonadota bacterium]
MTPSEAPEAPIDDCWNTIGVAGDRSCPKLTTRLHCRHCEVYADAARRNLQRPVDQAYQDEWAAHFRQVEHGAARQDQSVLVFRIGREWLALPTRVMLAVAPQARAHTLPHRGAGALCGVVNVGGQLYPCMALAPLLGIDDQEVAPAKGRYTFARLLLIEWEAQSYALPVADLHGIVRYAREALQAPAATINKGLTRFVTGVLAHQQLQVGCLDMALLGHQMERALR